MTKYGLVGPEILGRLCDEHADGKVENEYLRP
jgi:hypothetical protein